jgi:hypothetical protein
MRMRAGYRAWRGSESFAAVADDIAWAPISQIFSNNSAERPPYRRDRQLARSPSSIFGICRTA